MRICEFCENRCREVRCFWNELKQNCTYVCERKPCNISSKERLHKVYCARNDLKYYTRIEEAKTSGILLYVKKESLKLYGGRVMKQFF